MRREIIYTILKNEDGMRISDFLKSRAYTHQALVNLKKTEQGVLRNMKWAYLSDILHEKDELRILIVEQSVSEKIVPIDIALDIVYEDEDLVVVNKPSNMPIHPSLNNYKNTLANALMAYYQKRGEDFIFRCINRLDRDTTGLTIVAKHYLSAGILHSEMEQRKIRRNYVAFFEDMDIVDGTGEFHMKMNFENHGALPKNAKVDLPIYREDSSLIKRCVNEKGDRAITHYSYIGRFQDVDVIRFWLETGRTHQIRVHMSSLGYPLLGDALYGGSCRKISRVALHAACLEFTHPISRKKMKVQADLHEDMRELIGLTNEKESLILSCE